MSDTDLTVGSIVEDEDGTSPTSVVVNRPPIPAHDWYVNGRGFLSEDNPDYPDDDRTTVVIFEDDLEDHYPEYSGYEGIPMDQLNTDGVRYYAFPESRLRHVDELEQPVLSLDEIDPSPYHARNFDVDANRDYIERIAENGHPNPTPVVRPTLGGGYQILNGHKRIWASYVAGLESIPVATLPLDGIRGAKYWAQRHLVGYDERQQSVALDRLRARLEQTIVDEIEQDYCTTSHQEQTVATDGGHDS